MTSPRDLICLPAGMARLMLCAAGMAATPLLAGGTAPQAEVQINLCATPDQAIAALQLRPESAGRYQVWYFDTADLALFRQGVVVRLRVKDSGAELTLKFARQDCARPDLNLPPGGHSKCEYDVRGGVPSGTVSVSKNLSDGALRRLLDQPGSLQAELSPGQIEFLQRAAAVGPLPAPIGRLGPVQVQSYRRGGEKFVVEAWQFPAGENMLEISQKTKPGDATDLEAELLARLRRQQLAVCADQGSPARAKLAALQRR